MNAVILSCSSLTDYVNAAQEKLNTNYPVIYLDRSFHRDPRLMRGEIIKALGSIDENIDTVLVSMGYCGGSWEDVKCDKRIVLPRVDDCCTLLLTTDDNKVSDRKSVGHYYIKEKQPESVLLSTIFKAYTKDMDEAKRESIYKYWSGLYKDIDVIDTGLNDCRSESYRSIVEKDRKFFGSNINYVKGSNIILEKLISGKWDEQFIVIESGTVKNYL